MKIIDLSYLEDVSEATSVLGSGYLNVSVKNGKANIKSKGYKVVQNKKKTKEGESLFIKATSRGGNVSTYTNVSVTRSGSFPDKEFEKEIADFEKEDW
jgi:hypothetical protein